jgi:hypothetical protein
VLIGGLENNFPQVYQFILAVITLIAIVSALVVSFIAFQKVVHGDNESSVLLPAWDKATATWNKLYYCARNDVVFDPETRATLSNEQLQAIRTSATHQIPQEVSSQTQSAAVQH